MSEAQRGTEAAVWMTGSREGSQGLHYSRDWSRRKRQLNEKVLSGANRVEGSSRRDAFFLSPPSSSVGSSQPALQFLWPGGLRTSPPGLTGDTARALLHRLPPWICWLPGPSIPHPSTLSLFLWLFHTSQQDGHCGSERTMNSHVL